MGKQRTIFCLILLLSYAGASPAEERRHNGGQRPFNPFAGQQSRRQNRAQQNGQGQQQAAGGGGGGGGAAAAGGMGGGGGGQSLQYQPREQNKLEETQKYYEADAKEMKEDLKNYTTELAKMNQDLGKQIDKAKIPESPDLLKEIAKESSDVVQMTGFEKDAVNGVIGDEKALGDSVAKGYLIQAQAFLNAPQATPRPTPPTTTIGDEISALTHGGTHSNTQMGSALGTPSSGKTSNLSPIMGPGAQIGGGEHANAGAVRGPASVATSFSRGALYNAPASVEQK